MKALCLLLACTSAACILPVATGAPMPATTVGKGRMGFAISSEAPTLDLIADNGDENETGSPSAVSYGAAPAAATTMSLSYGLGDDTDLEVAAEGALYFFFLPMPTGASIGFRHHVATGDNWDLGFAMKGGYVSSDAEITTSSGSSSSSASANFLAIQGVIQGKHGFVRPLAALNLMPARIHRDPSDGDAFDFRGMASSLTLGAMFVGSHVQFGPYIAVTNFYSDRFDNSGFFFSGGLMLAVRPDRNRAPAPPVVQTMPPGYGPPPPPGYGPPPPGYGPPPPPPPPPAQ